MDANQLIVVAPEGGVHVAWAGGNYRVVIGGEQTGGQYAVIEMLVPPGNGPTPHSHAEIEESFTVLEGEVTLTSEQGAVVAKQGALVNIPLGGMVHKFENTSDKNARLWCLVVPAGLDSMFLELGVPAKPGEIIPPAPLSPDDQKRVQAVAEKYGQKLYPPDFLG